MQQRIDKTCAGNDIYFSFSPISNNFEMKDDFENIKTFYKNLIDNIVLRILNNERN